MPEDLMSVGDRWRMLRAIAGVTQEALGASLHVSGAAISEYERDKSKPSYATRSVMARILGVDEGILDPDRSVTKHDLLAAVYGVEPGTPLPKRQRVRTLVVPIGQADDSGDESQQPTPYHSLLTAAAAACRARKVGPDWSLHTKFVGRLGDEVLLRDWPAGSHVMSQFILAMEAVPDAERLNGIVPYALAQTKGLQALIEATPDLTVGEARYLADAVNFAGGHHGSKLAQDAEFYRQRLEELRAAMGGAD